MGQSFSAQILRVKLKMGVERCTMQQNKKSNAIRITRREIATLLKNGKDESARIRTEGLIYQENLLTVLELISVMFSFLSQRLQLVITSKPPCPEDFEETCATIIYCAARISEVPELREVSQQLGLKFGSEWAASHRNNSRGLVPPRIVTLLAATPPTLKRIVPILKAIAEEHDIEWEPKWASEEQNAEDPQALGAVARIRDEKDASEAAAQLKRKPSVQDVKLDGFDAAEEEEDDGVEPTKPATPAAAPAPTPAPSKAAPPSYDEALDQVAAEDRYDLPPPLKEGMRGPDDSGAAAASPAAAAASPAAAAASPSESSSLSPSAPASAPAATEDESLEERMRRLRGGN